MVHSYLAASLMALMALVSEPTEDRIVRVTVTSVAGSSVFLDKGKDQGLEPGLRVRLFPAGAPSVEGVIRDVSSSSSRAEMPAEVTGLLVGVTGEVTVPQAAEETPPEGEKEPERAVPEHPPWTRQEGDREPDQPLLAPAYSVHPSKRPLTVKGRIYTNLYFSQDRAEGRSSDFSNIRVGTWTTITNPLGHGGRILFAGQADYRSADVGSFGSDSETDLILDRLSYAVGGEEYAPYRLEFGRFYSLYAPELGLIDGVEGVLQMEGGLKVGAAVGAYPRPFPTRDWGDDIGFHVFMNYVPVEDDGHLDATLGYQKTWHEGSADRDLIFGRVNLRPTKKLWLYGSFKIDIYTGSDELKSSGADLTEAFFQVRLTPTTDTGATVSYSRYTWPELDRREYEFLPPDLVQDGEVNRLDLNTWWRMSKDVRLSGRVNYWEDQDSDGLGGEVSVRWSNAFNMLSSLETAVYVAQGASTEGVGFRIRAHQRFGEADAFLGYELFDYQSRTGATSDRNLTRQSVRGGLNWQINQWSYSLSGDYYFGDSEDVISLGAYIQYRF